MTNHTQLVRPQSRQSDSRALAFSYHVILSDLYFFLHRYFNTQLGAAKEKTEKRVSEGSTEEEVNSR